MSKIFGTVDKFGFEYELLKNTHEKIGVLKESWGMFRLWVDGVNICKYTHDGTINEYEWNLIYLIEWLCENLEYILGYDPYPLPVEGSTTLELLEKCDEFETEEDDEMYLWYRANGSWLFRHNWFNNRDGSTLSSVNFRRIGSIIEISWDNEFWKEHGVEFDSMVGVFKVSIDNFKSAILGFLKEILEELSNLIEAGLVNDREQISKLYAKVKLIHP